MNQSIKKSLILAVSASAVIAAHALPTYEPFTEFSAAASATGTNAIDLATGGYTAPGGESWGALNFSGTAGTHIIGLDIDVTNAASGTPFTASAIGAILPSTFPGVTGSDITTYVVNPEQPTGYPSANVVGNSAVLTFAQDITRPTNGVKTLFVSYLFSVAQKGQTGTGNDGRYLGFLEATNLSEGWIGSGPVPGAAYTNWGALFNTFGTAATSPKYFGHGVFNGSPEYLEPVDSSAGLDSSANTFSTGYNQASFVVGEFVFTTNGTATLKDTNILWVNPSIGTFGGATPPATPAVRVAVNTTISDIGGLVLIDRVGSGALGGIGTNYIANLIIGSTWSYVTGGPEFTNQPPAKTIVNVGGNISINGSATAAGQTVSYQWAKSSGGTTNLLSDGVGTAGGTATVSGSGTATLVLSNISSADTGNYQLVATASSTGYILNSSTALISLADPQIASNPADLTANYGQGATFTATATTSAAPLTYQWYKDGTPLVDGVQSDGSTITGSSGTTSSGSTFSLSLNLTNISYLDQGNYTLAITNQSNLNNSTAPAALTVHDPAIVTQPTKPSVAVGGNATFTVVANGSPSLSYQWFENGTALSENGTTATGSAIATGTQTPTLTLSGVSDADDGSYTVAITGSSSGQTITSSSVTLTVQDALTIVSAPTPLTERVGDHLAFFVKVTGGGPSFQWSFNGNPILGATKTALILTNIQIGQQGTYSVTVSNLVSAPQTVSAALTVINSALLPLASTNILVARIGDGAQTLSGATGNTLYLDQYTANGTYVSTVQLPDEAVGSPYGTGGSVSLPGSPALLFQGAGNDAENAAALTLSGNQSEYLTFAGYCQQYPFSGTDVSLPAATTGWRGLATINAFGIYTLAYTNFGLYSAGGHTIRSAVTLDGTNFYTTGAASSGGVKYVNTTVASYKNGNGVPTVTSSGTGPRVVQIVGGNLVFSDAAASPPGLYADSGTPEPGPSGTATSSLFINEGGVPNDFAFSPDGRTVYIADGQAFAGAGAQSGGIQRWDTNDANGGYLWSYTLPAEATQILGAQGLAASFPSNITAWGSGVTGAVLYATSTGTATNSLSQIADNGTTSLPTTFVTAGAKQALRGVRFGPSLILPFFAQQPQNKAVLLNGNATFSVAANGSGPLSYQWYFQAGGTGAFNAISLATNASCTVSSVGSANFGNYYVIVTNPGGQTAQSSAALLSLFTPPSFLSTQYLGSGNGFQLFFSGPAGSSYTIWTSPDPTLRPVQTQWTQLSTGNTFSGGTDTYIDNSNGGNSASQFYIISVP